MTKRRREQIVKRIRKIRGTAASQFTAGEQFALALIFSVPSEFRMEIEKNAKIKTEQQFLAAMYQGIFKLTGKTPVDTDLPGLRYLWNSKTKKVTIADPETISLAFVVKYTDPPCPRSNDQQPAILKALKNAGIKD